MSIIEAIIFGLVQGLTEFIPVSSSGHLVILHHLFGERDGGLTFDVALHIGTLTALIMFFYKEIGMLFNGILGRNEHKRLAWLLVAATVPAVIGGILLKGMAETSFRSVELVAVNLILIAFLMIAAEWYAKRRYIKKTDLESTTLKQGMLVGLAQVVALVPGVSRSGSTITAGIFAGMDRVAATRFSFLLAIPATFGAIVKTQMDGGAGALMDEPAIFAAGIVSALLSGLFAIRFLISYLAKHDLRIFAYYRIGLGLLVLALVAV